MPQSHVAVKSAADRTPPYYIAEKYTEFANLATPSLADFRPFDANPATYPLLKFLYLCHGLFLVAAHSPAQEDCQYFEKQVGLSLKNIKLSFPTFKIWVK
jgi:hypothetical protein